MTELIIKTDPEKDSRPERDNILDSEAVTKALKLIDEAIMNLEKAGEEYDSAREHLMMAKAELEQEPSSDIPDIKAMQKEKGKDFMNELMQGEDESEE
jgi:hypothetical protein